MPGPASRRDSLSTAHGSSAPAVARTPLSADDPDAAWEDGGVPPSALPDGDPVPDDGALPDEAARPSWATRPFGFYVHVPFCTVRCGYCDFNTYTPRSSAVGAAPAPRGRRTPRPRSPRSGRARRVLGRRATCRSPRCSSAVARRPCCPRRPRPVARGDRRGVRPGARRRGDDRGQPRQRRPPATSTALREGGFTRISFGMQSAVPHVLRDPRPHPRPASGCRPSSAGHGRPGFEQVSLDLIYGTPGESLDDWEASLDAALACEPDHVSAYSLIVEDGHRAGAAGRAAASCRCRTTTTWRTSTCWPTSASAAAGWAGTRCPTGPATTRRRCRHNLLYWTRRRLVGRRPGRPLPRRRRALVERQAPRGVRRAAGRRTQPGPRPRGARRRDAGGSSGCCSSCGCATGLPGRRSSTPTGRAAVAGPGASRPRRGRRGRGWC